MTSNIIVKLHFFLFAQHNEPRNTISQTDLIEASGVPTKTQKTLQMGEAATIGKSGFYGLFTEEREGNTRGEFERKTFF